ncbi:MAG: hypothetical protein LBC75_07365 [Fibromonadaceae bacterium]|jgi:hypothetical protein|nr:hypothetical protein [Fibromonadaceae bacterium]
MPSSENNFLIEFPADREYIPFVQDFFRDYLKSHSFSKEFSERVAVESSAWFDSVVSKEKFLHALPVISFNCRISESIISVEIITTDKKEFITSLSPQKLEA